MLIPPGTAISQAQQGPTLSELEDEAQGRIRRLIVDAVRVGEISDRLEKEIQLRDSKIISLQNKVSELEAKIPKPPADLPEASVTSP